MDFEKEWLKNLTKAEQHHYFMLKDLVRMEYYSYNKKAKSYTPTGKPMDVETQKNILKDLNETFQKVKKEWEKK